MKEINITKNKMVSPQITKLMKRNSFFSPYHQMEKYCKLVVALSKRYFSLRVVGSRVGYPLSGGQFRCLYSTPSSTMRHSYRNVKIKSDGDTFMGSDVYSSVSGNVDKSLVEEFRLHGTTMYCAAVNNSCQGIGVVCCDV